MSALQWSALRRIIMLPQLSDSESNPISSEYPSGNIWKYILVASIFDDLESGTQDDTATKRFIRIEHLGLSGAIFYNVPTGRVPTPSDQMLDSEINTLIERTAPSVLYFGNFACTSFVIGQVIKSHLLADPTKCPKPRPSGFGFSLNSRAFETLSHSLLGGDLTPAQNLVGQLKPTPKCADRVIKDRKRAKHAERLLLAIRYRDIMRNRVGIDTATKETTSVKLSSEPDRPCPEKVEEEEDQDEEYYDALDTLHTQSPPYLHSKVPVPRLDNEPKPSSMPALRANILSSNSSTFVDHDLGKKPVNPDLAVEKENSFST